MKSIKRLIGNTILISILSASVACHSSKSNSKTNIVDEVKTPEEAKPAPVEVTYADPAQQAMHEKASKEEPVAQAVEKESNYPFTVSFFSIGEGTDSKMQLRFKEYIDKFKADKNVELVYETNQWGREGEVDYCFTLSELNQKFRNEFIEHAKSLLSESKLVHVAENGQCHPKRR